MKNWILFISLILSGIALLVWFREPLKPFLTYSECFAYVNGTVYVKIPPFTNKVALLFPNKTVGAEVFGSGLAKIRVSQKPQGIVLFGWYGDIYVPPCRHQGETVTVERTVVLNVTTVKSTTITTITTVIQLLVTTFMGVHENITYSFNRTVTSTVTVHLSTAITHTVTATCRVNTTATKLVTTTVYVPTTTTTVVYRTLPTTITLWKTRTITVTVPQSAGVATTSSAPQLTISIG